MTGIVSVSNGTIIGATDGTTIGNTSDRLKVDANISTVSSDSDKPTFIATAYMVATAQNKSMFSIQNATGSTSTLRLRKLYIRNDTTTAVTGVVIELRLFRATSHTGGTTVTPLTFDTADSLNASITCRTAGTISGLAVSPMFYWKFSGDEWGVGALDVESSHYALDNLIPKYESKPGTKPITLHANETISLQCITNTTATTFTIVAVFTQE